MFGAFSLIGAAGGWLIGEIEEYKVKKLATDKVEQLQDCDESLSCHNLFGKVVLLHELPQSVEEPCITGERSGTESIDPRMFTDEGV